MLKNQYLCYELMQKKSRRGGSREKGEFRVSPAQEHDAENSQKRRADQQEEFFRQNPNTVWIFSNRDRI